MGDEEDFAQLSLPDQFAHKNWKARKGGYETAAKEFQTAQPSDPIVREFTLDSGLWKAAVGDSNVAAQQEALNAYKFGVKQLLMESRMNPPGLSLNLGDIPVDIDIFAMWLSPADFNIIVDAVQNQAQPVFANFITGVCAYIIIFY